MDYLQLENEYKEDALAEAMYSREMEHFHYNLDAVNFDHLLKVEPEGEQLEIEYQDCKSNVARLQDLLKNELPEEEKEGAEKEITETLRRIEEIGPPVEYRNDIKKRLKETRERMGQVDNIYNALKAQITSQEAHQAAVERTTKKREEANATRSDK